MFDLKKAKQLLEKNFLETIKLYFKSLQFQNIM